MKFFFAVFSCSLLSMTLVAQMKGGQIVYERKINLHKRIPAGQESMKNMIPEFNSSKVQLTFSEFESIYKNVPEEKDIRETAGESENGMHVIMRFGGADDETYKN